MKVTKKSKEVKIERKGRKGEEQGDEHHIDSPREVRSRGI